MASYDPSVYDPAYTLLQKIKNIEKYLKENPQAAGIQNVAIDENSHLIVTLTDGTIIDAGEIDAGAGVVIDAALSDTSTNPVQNRIIKTALDEITGELEEKLDNPMTIAGDLIVGGAGGVPLRLPTGTANQVLTMGPLATGPQWGPSPAPTGIKVDQLSAEDPSTGIPAPAGSVPTVDSNYDVVWGIPQSGGMTNPMTAAGDLIIGGTSGAPSRLGKGTAGQVLKINAAGTAPEWGDAGGGGGGLYEHNIIARVVKSYAQGYLSFKLINNLSTPMSWANVIQYLYDKGTSSGGTALPASGYIYHAENTVEGVIVGIFYLTTDAASSLVIHTKTSGIVNFNLLVTDTTVESDLIIEL